MPAPITSPTAPRPDMIALYFHIQTAMDHLQLFCQENKYPVQKSAIFDARLQLNAALQDITQGMSLHEHRVLGGILDFETTTEEPHV